MQVGDLVKVLNQEGAGIVLSDPYLSCSEEYYWVEVWFPHGIFEADSDEIEVINEKTS